MLIQKSKMLIDVDDVIVDNAYLQALNEFMGTNFKPEDFEEYYLAEEKLTEEEAEGYRDYVYEHNIYEDCKLMEDVEIILPIMIECMDIHICSSCIMKGLEKRSGVLFARKYDFLVDKFPTLESEKIILAGSKNCFTGFDYQVDDRLENLKGDSKNKFLFTRWHNRNISSLELAKYGVIRVNSWLEMLKYIDAKNSGKTMKAIWLDLRKCFYSK